MIRVLQVFGSLNRGGLESFVMNLYRAIDKNKIQFDFLLSSPGGNYEEEVKAFGARIYYLPQRNRGIRNYHFALDKFFAEHAAEYNAIHVHASSLSAITPLYYARKYGVKTRIIHSHSSTIRQELKANFLHHAAHRINKLRIGKLANIYLGCSDKALDWMYKGSGVRKKACMINNAIPLTEYKFNEEVRKKIREDMGLHGKFVVGHVGSFTHVKNHRFLISIFRDMLKEIPSAHLLIIGEGPLREQIISQIDNLGLKDNVTLAGLRSDVNTLLQGMDMIIMPSLFEGLPVSLVEAQASGLPVIASETISKDTAITPNIRFIPLSAGSEAWLKAIMEFHDHFRREDTSEFISKNGFDIKNVATYLSQIYSE